MNGENMRKLMEPVLGMAVVLTLPVLGVYGFQALAKQGEMISSGGHMPSHEARVTHASGACSCACCRQLNQSATSGVLS